jgi:hypothetical protein
MIKYNRLIKIVINSIKESQKVNSKNVLKNITEKVLKTFLKRDSMLKVHTTTKIYIYVKIIDSLLIKRIERKPA